MLSSNSGKKFTVEKPHLPHNCVKYVLTEGRWGDVIKTVAGKVSPWVAHDAIAEMFLTALNTKIHHNGSWRVVWTKPLPLQHDPDSGLLRARAPSEIEFHWLDKDGDANVAVYSNDKLDDLQFRWPEILQQCDQAWHKYHEFVHGYIQPGESEQYYAAKGQKAPSLR